MPRARIFWLSVCLLLTLTACADATTRGGPVPTATLASFETLPTAYFLTQNAPPAGFGTVQFDPVDRTLGDHAGWTYTVSGTFDGTDDDTGQPLHGRVEVHVQSNELGQTRRVLLDVEGRAFLPDEARLSIEGVRWSNDYYVVDVNGRCTVDEGGSVDADAAIGDLGAGQIIGGVRGATPTGHRDTIEGLEAWQYAFAQDQMRVPAVHTTPQSQLDVQGDLWIAPSVNAVLRYDVTANVSGVHLLWVDQNAAPVSGTLKLHYQLDIPSLDHPANIAIPNGC